LVAQAARNKLERPPFAGIRESIDGHGVKRFYLPSY
jgi:hypothetical protein